MPYPDVEETLPEAILAAELLSTTGKQHHAMHNSIHRLLNMFQKVLGTGWGDPSQPGFRTVRQRVEAVEAAIPVGAVMAYSGPYVAPDTAGATSFPAAPAGWAFCDGRAHGSSALSTLLGSPNTPDLRNKFVLGASATRPRGPSTEGEEKVKLSAAESGLPAHKHTINQDTANHGHTVSDTDLTHKHAGHDAGGHGHTTRFGWKNFKQASSAGSGVEGTDPGSSWSSLTIIGSADAVGDHSHGMDNALGNHKHVVGPDNATHGHTMLDNTAAAASIAHNNMPPFYSMVYIIRL